MLMAWVRHGRVSKRIWGRGPSVPPRSCPQSQCPQTPVCIHGTCCCDYVLHTWGHRGAAERLLENQVDTTTRKHAVGALKSWRTLYSHSLTNVHQLLIRLRETGARDIRQSGQLCLIHESMFKSLGTGQGWAPHLRQCWYLYSLTDTFD